MPQVMNAIDCLVHPQIEQYVMEPKSRLHNITPTSSRSRRKASAACASCSNQPTTASCRRSSGRCRYCRKPIGRAGISRRPRSTRRSAAVPTRSSRSTRAARSPIAACPITGAPTCRSTRGVSISMCSATTITATARSRSKRSRPGNTICARRIRRKPGRPPMIGPAVRDGSIKKITIPNGLPSPAQGFGYNLRRPIFQDPRVRQALAYAFDFEWSNKNLFYGLYTHTAELFRQFRIGRHRRAAGRGIEDPRQVSRPDPRRRVHDRIPAAAYTTARAISAMGWRKRWRC